MRIICVLGGVISGVGKGIAAASIARILKEYGYSVSVVKIDPYINFDAGTLRPTEHGEVWVTDDGGEIDLDLGNYERFLEEPIPKRNNMTTGQVYSAIIERERKGEYLGKTVEFIPHVPEEIITRIRDSVGEKDIGIVEIGGTVGDYENIPFLFAVKRLQLQLGTQRVAVVLVSHFPIPSCLGEPKSKPTQQSIRMLSENGLSPDFIICRSGQKIDSVRRKKIETYANIPLENVIAAPDEKHIYNVPFSFEAQGLGRKVIRRLGLEPRKNPDWSIWSSKIRAIESPEKKIRIGVVGKYLDIGEYSLYDSYISISESLRHAGAMHSAGIDINWVDAKKVEEEGFGALSDCRGIIVPGGFGDSGVEGKISAIRHAREKGIPFLGLCYGMQLAVIEFARNACGLEGANTTEVNPETAFPVIDVLPSQRKFLAEGKYGGTMRLGAYAASLAEGTMVHGLYSESGRIASDSKRAGEFKSNGQGFRIGNTSGEIVLERHRHRYEVNPEFTSLFGEKGLVFSGFHEREDGERLMEFLEIPSHRFFVATQAHPEFKSSLTNPSPLFLGFVKACVE